MTTVPVPADRLAAPLAGIWAAVPTPLGADGAPAIGPLAAHLRWLFTQGCHGALLFGSTGEAPSFSLDERRACLDGLVAADVPPGRLIVGTGACALPDCLALTRHALELGCRRVLVVPPFYFKPVSDDGLLRYYGELIERLARRELELLLYHFPRLAGVPLSVDLVAALRLRYGPNVAGIKDSSGDPASLRAWRELIPELAVFVGTERLLLPALRSGAAGCISATASLHGGALRAVFDRWQQDGSAADALQASLDRVREVHERWPVTAGLKALLARLHRTPGWAALRAPLQALDPAQEQALLDALDELDALPAGLEA